MLEEAGQIPVLPASGWGGWRPRPLRRGQEGVQGQLPWAGAGAVQGAKLKLSWWWDQGGLRGWWKRVGSKRNGSRQAKGRCPCSAHVRG